MIRSVAGPTGGRLGCGRGVMVEWSLMALLLRVGGDSVAVGGAAKAAGHRWVGR